MSSLESMSDTSSFTSSRSIGSSEAFEYCPSLNPLSLSSSLSLIRLIFCFLSVSFMLEACTLILPSRPDISYSSCEVNFFSIAARTT